MLHHKFKTIILLGQSGCGKSSIVRSTKDIPGIHYVVPNTSRPKRSGEQEGVDYYFTTDIAKEEDYIGLTNYNNWWYGYHHNSFLEDNINLIIGNLKNLESLLTDRRLEVLKVYYIDVPERIRLLRSLEDDKVRDVEEIIRRFSADKEEYDNFKLPFKLYLEKSDIFARIPNWDNGDYDKIIEDIKSWTKNNNNNEVKDKI